MLSPSLLLALLLLLESLATLFLAPVPSRLWLCLGMGGASLLPPCSTCSTVSSSAAVSSYTS